MSLDAELAESLAAWGVAPPAAAPEPRFEVMLANQAPLEAWLACETQWRAVLTPSGQWAWLGLDYAGVEVVLRHLGPDDPAAVFADLQLMERSALAAFNEIA